MPRSKKKLDKSDEALNSPVNLSGAGEDQVVKDLLSDKFVKGTNAEALEIGMALQQIIRGQSALLENQSAFTDQIAKLRQRMDEMDKAASRWEQDREGFIQEVLDRAEKLRATGDAKDRRHALNMQ
jgi:hypothetical protein